MKEVLKSNQSRGYQRVRAGGALRGGEVKFLREFKVVLSHFTISKGR